MADVHTLKPVEKFEPNKETIELLEEMLADAKAGKIESFWGIQFEPDDVNYCIVASGNFQTLSKIGIIEAIKHDLIEDAKHQ